MAQARPYFLALAAFLLSSQTTVSGLAEYAELRAGLRLGDRGGLIRSVSRTYQASLFPGKDIFETRHQQQRGAIQLASLEGEIPLPREAAPQDITGSLPGAIDAPMVRRAPRPYPTVNRANKGDRRMMRDGTRTALRMDPRTGRIVKLSLPAPSAKDLALRGSTPDTASAEPMPATPVTAAPMPIATATIDVPMPPNVTALAALSKTRPNKKAAPKGATLAAQRNRELMCLAKAIYFEARSEPEQGQIAVAQVIQNRVANEFYPDNICDVVFQNQHRRNSCQFSFACDGLSDRPRNQTAWARSIVIAKKSMHGKRIAELGKSTHYHANYVSPRWISDMVKLKRIGKHIFYRVRAWS